MSSSAILAVLVVAVRALYSLAEPLIKLVIVIVSLAVSSSWTAVIVIVCGIFQLLVVKVIELLVVAAPVSALVGVITTLALGSVVSFMV